MRRRSILSDVSRTFITPAQLLACRADCRREAGSAHLFLTSCVGLQETPHVEASACQRLQVATDTEVRLAPLTLLFGANAAGKSNFLDSLQLLSKLATSRTLKEAFDPPYRGSRWNRSR